MASGQVALALVDTPVGVIVARILVGGGDAMTFISVLRLMPAWFPTRQVPLVTQLTGLLGQVGQIGSTIPLVALLHGVGWRWSYLGAGAMGVLVGGPGAGGGPRPAARGAGAWPARQLATGGARSRLLVQPARHPAGAVERTSPPSSPGWSSPCSGASRS